MCLRKARFRQAKTIDLAIVTVRIRNTFISEKPYLLAGLVRREMTQLAPEE